jgi:DNA-binding PadR family transcriptional regulator
LEKSADLLPGTLDMLILKAASLAPIHGYGILLRIRDISGAPYAASSSRSRYDC